MIPKNMETIVWFIIAKGDKEIKVIFQGKPDSKEIDEYFDNKCGGVYKWYIENNKFIVEFKQWMCNIVALYYSPFPSEDPKARKAIILMSTGDNQMVAVATVNIPDYPCEGNQVYVKDYSENDGMIKALICAGIVKPEILTTIPSRFVTIPLMELTPEAMKLWEKKE